MQRVFALKNPLVFLLGGLLLLGAVLAPFGYVSAQDATAPTSQPTATANGSGEDSGNISLASMGIGAILSPVALISYAVFSLAKGVLWISGIIFNYAVLFLVFEFAKHLGTTPGMLLGWSLLRDLGNIMLLFSFIWIGIRMILNVSHFSAGKTLAQLVLFATLLNFSLFISAAIVDGSNGLTLALFSQNVGYKCDESMEKCLNDGVAGQILQQVNILSVVGGSGQEMNLESQVSSYLSKPLESILQFLLLSIIVSVAAAVLLAGGLLIVTRGITLAFILVTSPIGFAGMAFEPLHEMSEKWWKALINNALFAPVFLVLLFLGLRLTDGLATLLGTEGGFAGALAGGGSLDAGPIFLFVLVIGFMIAALMVGKKFGIAGADFAIKAATMAATSPYLPLRDQLGKRLYDASKKYDRSGFARGLRSTPLAFVDDAIKSGFDSGKKVSLPGWGSYADQRKANESRDKELRHAQHDAHLEHEFNSALAEYGTDPSKLKKFLNETSIADLHKMDILTDKNIGMVAESMDTEKFKQFMQNHDVPEALQHKGEEARQASIQAKLDSALAAHASGNPDALVKFMKDTGGYDLKHVAQLKTGGPALQTMAGAMGVESFKKFMDDKDVPEALRKQGAAARKAGIQGALNTAIADAARGNREPLEKLMRETSEYDLARTSQAEAGGAALEVMARHMSPEKFSKFYGDTTIPTPVRERYKQARFRELKDDVALAARGDATAKKRVQSAFDADIVASDIMDDPAQRQNLIRTISDDQYKGLKNNRTLGAASREAIEEIRYGTSPGSRFDAASVQATIDSFQSKKNITQVPAETLAERSTLDAMSPAHFYELANAKNLSDVEKAPIEAYVQSKFNTATNRDWAIFEATAPAKQVKALKDYFNIP